jgi:hypothetical protein
MIIAPLIIGMKPLELAAMDSASSDDVQVVLLRQICAPVQIGAAFPVSAETKLL